MEPKPFKYWYKNQFAGLDRNLDIDIVHCKWIVPATRLKLFLEVLHFYWRRGVIMFIMLKLNLRIWYNLHLMAAMVHLSKKLYQGKIIFDYPIKMCFYSQKMTEEYISHKCTYPISTNNAKSYRSASCIQYGLLMFYLDIVLKNDSESSKVNWTYKSSIFQEIWRPENLWKC